jgi:hypothetical protein
VTKATKKETRAWMLRLMARQAPRPVNDIEADVALSVASFAAKFPADAFCAASVDHVAGLEKWWNEATVMRRLQEWCDANNATPSNLPIEAEEAPVGRSAKLWLAHYYRAENDAHATRALDLIHSRLTMSADCQEAWTYLTEHDNRAALIALYRRWLVPSRTDLAADWDDEEGIRRKVRQIAEIGALGERTKQVSERMVNWIQPIGPMLIMMLVHCVKRHAAQHAGALADELRTFRQNPEAQSVAAEAMKPVPVAFPNDPLDLLGG